MAPLGFLEQRTKDAVKGQVQAAKAQVQRQTSIVRLASAGLRSPVGKKRGKKPAPARPEPRPGVYAQTTLDGYLRRSPVQEIRTAPGYRAALVKRAVAAVLAVLALAAVAMVLLRVL